MSGLDPRRHAFRSGLADERLRGKVESARFVDGHLTRLAVASAPLRPRPDASARIDTEVLYGEAVRVFDEADGWAWVQLETDGYVGYLPAATVGPGLPAPTHRVGALRTYVYPEPDIKSPPRLLLSLGSLVTVESEDDKLARLAAGRGWIARRHLDAIGAFAPDFVAVAQRFVGTPYLWGGRTSLGLDCSGLLQVSMQAAGLACPRDSDMQRAEVGAALAGGLEAGLVRGDILGWRGHVGIMVDASRLLHANGHHMETVIEPAAEAVARIATAGTPLACVRRPAALGRISGAA